MMRLVDLKPFPSAREQVRAMKKMERDENRSRAEFADELARLILAEREAKAARSDA